MKHILAVLIICFSLTSCTLGKVVRLHNPDTGHIVKCSGSAEMPEVIEVNNCIYDYEQMGYERWRG